MFKEMKEYLEYVKEDKSEGTYTLYKSVLGIFVAELEIHSVSDLANLTQRDYNDYVKNKNAFDTAKTHFTIIKLFLSYLIAHEIIEDGVLPKWKWAKYFAPKKKRGDEYGAKLIESEDLEKLLAYKHHLGDRVLAHILYYTGRRRGDVSNIRIGDLSFHRSESGELVCEIFFGEGKTGKRSVISLPEEASLLIEKYLDKEARRLEVDFIPDSWALFGSYNRVKKKPMSDQSIRNRVSSMCKVVGCKNYTPHDFRYTRGNYIYHNYGANEAMHFLRHSSIRTTETWYKEKVHLYRSKVMA